MRGSDTLTSRSIFGAAFIFGLPDNRPVVGFCLLEGGHFRWVDSVFPHKYCVLFHGKLTRYEKANYMLFVYLPAGGVQQTP